jgi:superfamily II DNA or RNA helicase
VIGLTATPFSRGLGKHYAKLLNVTTTRWLIDHGWLSPYRIYECVSPDMTGVGVAKNGEWKESEASDRAKKVIGDVVAEYLKNGEGRKFICSGVDTDHVDDLHRRFQAAGVATATYTYKDLDEDRTETVDEFRKPDSRIRGLITVTAASRGFDVADVSCIICARPLRKSLAEHIQLLGRGLRIYPGKTDCLILDHSGNCRRFYERCESFFDDGATELDDGKTREKPPIEDKAKEPMKCPACRAMHKPSPVCPHCGHQYPARLAKVQEVPGTMRELIAGGHRKVLTEQLWPQICGYVARHTKGDVERDSKRAWALYCSMTGSPPVGVSYSKTTPVAPSEEVRRRITHENLVFATKREKERAAT